MAKRKDKPREHPEPTEQLKAIGERLRSIRIAKGYANYESFAYENGIPRAQYGRYERGQDMKLSSLMKVLKGFDMTLGEFFSDMQENAQNG